MKRDSGGSGLPPVQEDDLTQIDDQEMLALVQSGARRLDRQIRHRDWRELIASAIVAVVIAPAMLRGAILGRIGAAIILGGLIVIAFRLWRARRLGGSGAVDLALPVAAALRAELERVNSQIALLQSAAWWYVTPLIGGAILLVVGTNAVRAPWFTLTYTLLAALLGWGIIALNAYAVRRSLQPKREELTVLLTQLDS